MSHENRRLFFLLVGALVIAIGSILSLSLMKESTDGDSSVPTVEARTTERPVEARAQVDAPTSVSDQFAERIVYSRAVTGRLVWKGGLAVAGGQVRCGAHEVATDAAGAFRVEDASVPTSLPGEQVTVAIAVLAPCWDDWLDVMATARPASATNLVELGDIELDPQVDFLAEIDWSREFADLMAGSGVDSIRLEMKTSVPGQLNGSRVGDATASIQSSTLRLRCRVPGADVASLRMSLVGPPRPQSMMAEQVHLLRTGKNHWVRHLGVEDLVRGRVCDHRGEALPEAGLEMATKGFRAEQAPTFLTVPVGQDGRFIAYLDRRLGASMRASLHGTRSRLYEVASGPDEVVIAVDLASHARFQLRRGGMAVPDFRLDVQPTLFARQDVPDLPSRQNGMAWCPKWALPRAAYLSWREDDRLWEEVIELGAPDSGGVIAFDLDAIRPQVLYNVAIKNSGHSCSIRLTRVDPPPASPKQRLTRFLQNAGDASICGVPPGQYEIDITTGIRRSPSEKHFTATVMIRGDGEQIVVDDIVNPRKG